MSWVTSLSCTAPEQAARGDSLVSKLLAWIAFIFLSPCIQHGMSSLLHLCCLTLLAIKMIVWRFFSRSSSADLVISQHDYNGKSTSANTRKFSKLDLLSTVTLWLLVLMSLASIAVAVCHIVFSGILQRLSSTTIFSVIQCSAWLVFCLLYINGGVARVSQLVRIWWAANAGVIALEFSTVVVRLMMDGFAYDLQLKIDDFFVLIALPVSIFLVFIAFRGIDARTSDLSRTVAEPLLSNYTHDFSNPIPVTGYANANIFNKAVFFWMNSVLNEGAKRTLQFDDIPQLATSDKAENTYGRLKSNWVDEPTAHPVRWALMKCFWRPLAFTGFVALIRVCVMYVGPILVQRFVDFTEGKADFDYEGYILVLVLLLAKSIEVLSSHQYNFLNQKLGNNIRSSLITTVYRKGLRFSSSARQAHGVGQIVNYMSVDVQQLSDVILQVHYIWTMPLQVGIALAILYRVVGISMFAGLIVMITVVVTTVFSTNKQRIFQREVMKLRDLRMKATNAVLNHMKIIKLQAWEEHFRRQVEAIRKSEYFALAKFMYTVGATVFTLWNTPSLVSVTTFTACILLKQELTAGKVFTATATFRILQEPIRNFPQALISISQAMVSLDRLDRYMHSKELEPTAVEKLPFGEETAVSIENGSFSWDEDEKKLILHDITLSVQQGSLVAVVGSVGSGKSSLLASILGEIGKVAGVVKVSGSTAYVSQTAWIQNGTVEENILFGSPKDIGRYRETIRVCSLEPDISVMEYGDQTEIGERGINLSGGQKQRIQLARAVYQDCDIYLLDDIFSAVDAHTGSDIFNECILGVLHGKSIILVTHQVEFLHRVDLILVMDNGRVIQKGKYDDILTPGTEFEALVAAHRSSMGMVDAEISKSMTLRKSNELNDSNSKIIRSKTQIYKEMSIGMSQNKVIGIRSHLAKQLPRLIEEEERGRGGIGWKVYWLYLTKAFGWPLTALLILVQLIWQILSICSDYWLADQTGSVHAQSFHPWLFIRVYFLISLGTWICIAVRTFLVTIIGIKTSQDFYLGMLQAIFRAPMLFFDTTPSGRVLSRSSADQTNLDVFLPFFFGACLAIYILAIGVLIVTCQVTWPIVFLVLPLSWVYLQYQAFYIRSSREITRMDSITKAPVIHHFSETISGVVIIRCFRKEGIFSQLNLDRVNTNLKMDFHNIAANEWLGYRLEMLGTIVLCSAALLLVTLPNGIIKPEKVGLSLSYGLALNSSLFWSVWLACMIENKMVSVERIQQYTDIQSEAPLVIDNCLPSQMWPLQGMIIVKDLKIRYRPSTPLVLKGISFDVEGGCKIGVVGRTGSGKSTLVQAMFRLVEPCSGQILIDGVDILTLGLHQLRSRLGIIPQDPVLFDGTVRSNIDPLGHYNDEEIWKALQKCQLSEVVSEKEEKLDSPVIDNGDNWSVGQCQLLCLGRALLKKSQLLFLDEATASIDSQTDATMQKIIREEFVSSTVISIAHRLPTVMDSDKVVVLDSGYLKEYDTPSQLSKDPTTLFASLVHEYASR